jgi:hypothetical protein
MWIIYTRALRRHRILPLVNFVVLLLKIRLFVELWQVIDRELDVTSLVHLTCEYVIGIWNCFRLCSIPSEHVTSSNGKPDLLEVSLAAVLGHGRLDATYGAKESAPNRHLVTTITRHDGRSTIEDWHWIIADLVSRIVLISNIAVCFERELPTLE